MQTSCPYKQPARVLIPAISLVLVIGGVFCVPSIGETSAKQFAQLHLFYLLSNEVAPNRVAALIAQRGVDFELTPEIEKALRESGANDAVIAGIRDYNRAHPPLERPLPPTDADKKFAALKQEFSRGQALHRGKKFTEAAAVFEQAISLADPKNVGVVIGSAADSYSSAGNMAKAEELYQKAVRADPDEATYHINLGNVYARTARLELARAEFKKAAELDPQGAWQSYFNLGAISYNNSEWEEAIAAFRKAVEINPNIPDLYYLLGMSLIGTAGLDSKGRQVVPPGTAAALEKYLELDPNGKYAASARELLAEIRRTR